MTLEGLWQLRVVISQCHTTTCPLYHVRYHPEEEGSFALPHGEYGLDVIALIGAWRFVEHRSVQEMHQRLHARGLSISEREEARRQQWHFRKDPATYLTAIEARLLHCSFPFRGFFAYR